jgi:patatin-related protein
MVSGGGGDGTEGPVRRRFVVDVISGTSAGGINGVCLAKALANGTSVAGLKHIWLNDGDIGGLINDRDSVYEPGPDGTPQLIPDLSPDFEPKSLLNSDRMFVRLITAFGAMNAPDPANVPPLVDDLDLWVTATDLDGNQLPTQLWNATSWERRHANRYHFRRSSQDGSNDFKATDNPFLAFAARCTSSFPFAFQPMTLSHVGDFPSAGGLQPDWARFYPDYAPTDFPARFFSDGGILDNKPFSYATGSLVGRRAPLPVDRKLIYVEPDPSPTPAAPDPSAPAVDWNGIATAQAAVLKIPRVEGIRGDIQTVLRRNREIERARDIVFRAGTDPLEYGYVSAVAFEDVSGATWADISLEDTIRSRNWGPAYATYHRLKVRGLVDYLALLVVSASGLNPESDDLLAVHYLVRVWKDARFAEQPAAGLLSENHLLIDFSLPYRRRRLSFVLKKLKQLGSDDPEAVRAALAGCGLALDALPGGDAQRELLALRRDVTKAEDVLYAAERRLASRPGPLTESLAALGIGRADLQTILASPDDDVMQASATTLLARIGQDSFTAVTEAAKTVIVAASNESRDLVEQAIGTQVTAESLAAATDLVSVLKYAARFYYDAFEAFDLLLYPLEFGTAIAETNPVEILRISPVDAHLPADATDEDRDLRGKRINHFGAFFDLEWRKHDMLWGRLNAAEILIRSLVPDGRDPAPLIDEAHRTIVAEFAAEHVPAIPESESWQWFLDYDPPNAPERAGTVAALDRAAAVMGAVVGGIKSGPPAAIAPGWTVLRSVMRPNPGGWSAVLRAGKLMFLRTTLGKIAIAVWIAVLLVGILLVALDWGLWVGVVLIIASLALALAVAGGMWFAIRAIRSAIEKRVGTFFWPPAK